MAVKDLIRIHCPEPDSYRIETTQKELNMNNKTQKRWI